jgi:hypothetical protein
LEAQGVKSSDIAETANRKVEPERVELSIHVDQQAVRKERTVRDQNQRMSVATVIPVSFDKERRARWRDVKKKKERNS